MKRRCGILLLTAFCAWSSGCAGTALREDGSPIFGPRAWVDPPAPPQKQVALTTSRTAPMVDGTPKGEGLAKYFPGLRRDPIETRKVAAKTRPSWFGLRSTSGTGTQTYMTDAREHLNRSGPEPTALPVALQVPTDKNPSDRQVTPTNAETTIDDKPAPPQWESPRSAKPSAGDEPLATAAANVPDFGGKPSKPGEDEVNPLPPAAEPDSPAGIAAKMPKIPSVDPEVPAKPASTNPADSDEKAVQVSATPEAPKPSVEPSKPTQPTIQAVESSKMTPTSARVLASSQSAPPKPTVLVAKPTPQAKPSPQGVASPTTHHWKRPCLRRLVRKLCNLGEYADPPTAAPH